MYDLKMKHYNVSKNVFATISIIEFQAVWLSKEDKVPDRLKAPKSSD